MTWTRRISQAIAGIALAALGVTGLSATWMPAGASAQPATDDHEAMHAMMQAMHGEEAVVRMHEADGAKAMMDQCTGVMETMGGMSNMKNGRGMPNMMNGTMRR